MWCGLFLSLNTMLCIVYSFWPSYLLVSFPFPDLLQKVQSVQTDNMTEEVGVNTDTDWESQVAAMLDYSSSLTEQYDNMKKQQGEEGVAHEKQKQQVQRRKEEATRQHQVRPSHCLKVKTQAVPPSHCDFVSRLFWTNWSLCELNCSWTTPRPPGRTSYPRNRKWPQRRTEQRRRETGKYQEDRRFLFLSNESKSWSGSLSLGGYSTGI